jgi:hypothetical protein
VERGGRGLRPRPDLASHRLTVPRLSILIPTRNRAAYLAGALSSARAQDLPDIEIIVSDNASTDGTSALLAGLADPRVRTVRQEQDLGMVGNWNACLALARGDLVLVLSDDDELYPHAARTLAAAMNEPGAILAYGLVDVVDGSDLWLHRSPAGPAREVGADFVRGRLLFGACREPHLCATVFRRSTLLEQGGFPEVGNLADLTAEVRLGARLPGEVLCIPEALGRYRHHGGSLTADPRRALGGFGAVRDHLLADPAVPAAAVRHYATTGLWSFLIWRKVGVGVGAGRGLADLRLALSAGLPWGRRIPALGLVLAPRPLLLALRWAHRRMRGRDRHAL